MKAVRYFLLTLFVFGAVSVGTVSADSTTPSLNSGITSWQTDSGCVIPESGPWPPCATGGSASEPANPPADTASDACIIPESGPWPPCASDTPAAANTQQTRRYAQWEVRNTFIEIFNKDFGMADGEYGYINKWQPDTSITFDNGVMRMTSYFELPNGDVIYHDFGAAFSLADGEPRVDTRWLNIGSRQIGGEDLALVEDFIELFFRAHTYAELQYAEVLGTYIDGDELVITYK